MWLLKGFLGRYWQYAALAVLAVFSTILLQRSGKLNEQINGLVRHIDTQRRMQDAGDRVDTTRDGIANRLRDGDF